MEYDRYKKHHMLYVIGIVSLLLCLTLLFFLLYVTPYLVWDLQYNVPELVAIVLSFFENQYDLTVGQSKLFFWLIFFIPTLITGYISYYVSNRIDNEIYHEFVEPEGEQLEEEASSKIAIERRKADLNESFSLGFKIFGLMVVIVGGVLLLELLVQLTA